MPASLDTSDASDYGSGMTKIHRVVLTGSPCGGKTTILARLSDRFESLGFKVFCVPEAATLLINGGFKLIGTVPENTVLLQTMLLNLQLNLEKSFYRAAQLADKSAIIICDRGTMDSAAFVSPETWQAVLDENNWSTVGLRDKHYDAVIHLVTAAKGAEQYYTLANNPARTETPEQARALDDKLIAAWTGHSHLRVIDNSTDFEGKVRRTIDAMCRIVGIPHPVEIERKYLVKSVGEIPAEVHCETVEIEQIYLTPVNGTYARIRRRGQNGSFTYFHTVKKELEPGVRIEEERKLSPREYASLLGQADPRKMRIRKTRTCFMWNNQYFELDTFKSPCKGLVLLEVELDRVDDVVALPPFIAVERDVSEELSNYDLSSGLDPVNHYDLASEIVNG